MNNVKYVNHKNCVNYPFCKLCKNEVCVKQVEYVNHISYINYVKYETMKKLCIILCLYYYYAIIGLQTRIYIKSEL